MSRQRTAATLTDELTRSASARMYTDRKVTRVLRPVAVSVVLILGTLPGAFAVCQWACARAGGTGEHAAHHQHHSVVPPPATPSEGPSLTASDITCAHLGVSVVTAVISAGKVTTAMVSVSMTPPFVSLSGVSSALTLVRSTHSPPGYGSGPIPLRL